MTANSTAKKNMLEKDTKKLLSPNASKVQAKPDTNSSDVKADSKEVVDIGFVTFFPTLDTTVAETAKNAE